MNFSMLSMAFTTPSHPWSATPSPVPGLAILPSNSQRLVQWVMGEMASLRWFVGDVEMTELVEQGERVEGLMEVEEGRERAMMQVGRAMYTMP
jgi:hypothetical protein